MIEKEWPKTLYRPAEAGGIEHRSFAAETDVPSGEGWTDFKSAKAESKPEPKPAPRSQKEEERLQKQIKDLTERLVKAQNNETAERINAEGIREAALGYQRRVGELEAFLSSLAAEAKCPEALKAEIANLLSPDEAKRKRASAKKAQAGE